MRERVRLVRRVSFSSGHRYWIPSKSEAENRAIFGQWASPYNHGHNYVLDVACEGPLDSETGMVVNIKDIDDVLQRRVVARFDQKSINDEVPHFHDKSPTLENMLLYLLAELSGGVLPADLVSLKLQETPLLWAELTVNDPMNLKFTRMYEFAASHRLHVPSFSNEKNIELFGKCNNEAGHGHNYLLEVTVEGTPDTESGMMVDLGQMDSRVEELVVDRYDHKNLNVDLPEFHGRPTTSEVVAKEIFERLNGQLPAKLSRIRLHETARNIFEVER